MKRFLILFLVFLGACAQQETVTSDENSVSVAINDFEFSPYVLHIKQGAAVTWTNQDALPHTVTSDSFDSGQLDKGDTWTHSFNEKGTYEYSCTYHSSMKGVIVVE